MERGVAVLLEDVNRSETYLMLAQSNSDFGDYYAPPAGHIEEFDDNPFYAAVREVYEETGIRIGEDELEEVCEEDADYSVDKILWCRTSIDFENVDIELNHESSGYGFITRAEALMKRMR